MALPQMLKVIPQTTSFRVLGDQNQLKRDCLLHVMKLQVFSFPRRVLLGQCPQFRTHLHRSCVEERRGKKVLPNLIFPKQDTEDILTRAKGTNGEPQVQSCHHGSPAVANLRTGWTSPNYHVSPSHNSGRRWGPL